jgi:hypothetical protein
MCANEKAIAPNYQARIVVSKDFLCDLKSIDRGYRPFGFSRRIKQLTDALKSMVIFAIALKCFQSDKLQ